MSARHQGLAATAAGVALAFAGCGGSTPAPRHPTAARPAIPHPLVLPTPGPTGLAPSPSAVAVIKGWSTALREGRLDAAAAYFATPSAFVNGGSGSAASVVTIRGRAEARLVNASLPCGATFVSADQRGRYVNALFRLGPRAGLGAGGCSSGSGQTARTNFLISGGKILEWIRAPDDPGDNGGGAPAPSPSPTSPTPGGTPVV